MLLSRFAASLLALVWATTAWAVDLDTIERALVREPMYRGKPRYCLLVFGPEARTRMWLVVDGDTLYLDRTGQGDLTGMNCMIPRANWNGIDLGAIGDSDGTSREGSLWVRPLNDGFRLDFKLGALEQQAGSDRKERIVFAERPDKAPIIHFAGPLTIRWYREPPNFTPGQECDFNTMLGTPGIGKGSFAAILCCGLPAQAKLTGQLEFPHRDPKRPPIVKEVRLEGD